MVVLRCGRGDAMSALSLVDLVMGGMNSLLQVHPTAWQDYL